MSVWLWISYEYLFCVNFRTLSRDEMLNLLGQCQDILEQSDSPQELSAFSESLKQYQNKFSDISGKWIIQDYDNTIATFQ